MNWFFNLIQMASRFRGAAAILTFCVSALVLLISWLFGNNSFGTLLTNASQLSSTEALVLALTTLFLIVGTLVIVLFIAQKSPKPSTATLFCTVHDSTDPTKTVPGATIRLMLPEPIGRIADEKGSAVFVLPQEHIGHAYFINAAADNYKERKAIKVKIADRTHVLLPLDRMSMKQPVAVAVIPRNYLYVSKSKVDMLFGQLNTPPPVTGGTYSELTLIETHLEANGLISPLPKPERYFEGSMDAVIALLGPYVYFGGKIGKVYVALFGAPKHVIGNDLALKKGNSRGFYAYLEGQIKNAMTDYIDKNGDASSELLTAIEKFGPGYFVPWINGDLQKNNTSVPIQFLAQRIVATDENAQEAPCVIASPIYVALK